MGTLGLVLLRVSSGTVLPIFIEIGSDLTEKEQKISWHSFFETQCITSEYRHTIVVLMQGSEAGIRTSLHTTVGRIGVARDLTYT